MSSGEPASSVNKLKEVHGIQGIEGALSEDSDEMISNLELVKQKPPSLLFSQVSYQVLTINIASGITATA